MTELEQLLTEALASQSGQVASLAERLDDLTELLLATRAQQDRLASQLDYLMALAAASG